MPLAATALPLLLFLLHIKNCLLFYLKLCLAFPSSPYVVKYYGSYFKNTDLWIVMEYCGAGSVSDIIRLRNKTVRAVSYLPYIPYTFLYILILYLGLVSSMFLLTSVNRGGDCHYPEVNTERSWISSLHEEDPSGHQGRKHPPQHWRTCQTCRFWSCWTANGNLFWLYYYKFSTITNLIFQGLF